ncbi:hypothetical protein HY546_02295 [archaeon]|nr:hypothetical protein [archaeon]
MDDSVTGSDQQPAQPTQQAQLTQQAQSTQQAQPTMIAPQKNKCSECGREFGARESLEQHKLAKHSAEPAREQTKRPPTIGKKRSYTKYVIFGIIVIGIAYGFLSMGSRPDNLEGVRCESMEGVVIHIHPALRVLVGGSERVLPANVGVTGSCMYWLHTHDPTGQIHVESSVNRPFTLGQFLKVWNKTQRETIPFSLNATPERVLVDGQNYTGDYWSIVFKDGQQIELHFP